MLHYPPYSSEADLERLSLHVIAFFCLAGFACAEPIIPVDFNRDVRPILSDRCYQCHGPDADPRLIEAWSGLGARLIPCATTAGQIDASALLQELGQAGLTSVFCEGGGALAASLLSAGLVDELIGFTAGVMIGAEGQPALGALGLSHLASAPRFDLIESRAIGPDILHRWVPQG